MATSDDMKKNLQLENAESVADKDIEDAKKKYPYPKSIAFIVSNEFCERFSFYGMRTILSLYLHQRLGYSESDSIIIYHVWTMFVYFFPIFGAMIADSWLGRFRTIFYLSIVYALGSILMSLTAIPPLNIPDRAFSIIALLLIAMGTGGIKPCVSAFGGDQFRLPQQERQLATFFSLFYFSINAGSFISTFITPILRVDVQCYDGDCYPLAFGVPAALMITSLIIFLLGKPLYLMKNPTGNILLNVCKCIGHALSRKSKLKKIENRDHWLDYADDKYSQGEINDIKAVLKVLVLFLPLPVFWALFDQQGSRWTFQATRMDGSMGDFVLKPDQMQVVNPLLILIFIPLFEVAIYPALKWCRLVTKPLHKMIMGGLLAAIAFIVSGIVEVELQKTYPVLPGTGIAHLRLYNAHDCNLNVSDPSNILDQLTLKSLSYVEYTDIHIKGQKEIHFDLIPESECHIAIPNGRFTVKETHATGYFITNNGMESFEDSSEKTNSGNPAIRVLSNLNKTIVFEEKGTDKTYSLNSDDRSRLELLPSTYIIKVGGTIIGEEKMDLGAVYVLIFNNDSPDGYKFREITPPNSVFMLWLIPQYILLTMGEVMFSVTGLEFAFTQAPSTMKSVLTAGWLLTVAFGNLIVVIIAEAKIFDNQADEFFLFAGLMIADMIVFWLMTLNYVYVDVISNSITDSDSLPMSETNSDKQGIENKALEIDDKDK